MVRGLAAHSGRARHEGRSAIRALATLIEFLEKCNEHLGLTINCGWVTGGGEALNIVPDFAVGGCDIRVARMEHREWVRTHIVQYAEAVASLHDLDIELIWTSERPPKVRTPELNQLIKDACESAAEIGVELVVEDSGGATDGNILSAHGLPNLDSLGVFGGGIHSDREFADLNSIPPRAEIAARVIKRGRDRHMKGLVAEGLE